MKHLMMIALLMFAVNANAGTQCSTSTSEEKVDEQMEIKTDVPKHLEGATITITLKDGRTSTVPAEKFKVVPRKQQYIVTKTSRSSKEMCSTNETQHHRVSVLGGHGAKPGLDSNRSSAPDEVTVESRVGAVFGAQYQYKSDLKVLDMPLSIGIQGQTNKTGSLLIGVDF